MAEDSKLARVRNGPGWFEITFGALLSVVLGVVLAFFHLIFKPVETLKGPVKETVVGMVYYRPGNTDSAKSRQWTRKRQMLVEGGSAEIAFVEEELNAWTATASAGPTPPNTSSTLSFAPETLNVRIDQSVLQVGVPGKVTAFGTTVPLVMQARGTFAPSPAGYVFDAQEFYIGSLPTHRVPGLKELLMRRIIASQQLPEEVMAAWRKVSRVSVENNTLRISLP